MPNNRALIVVALAAVTFPPCSVLQQVDRSRVTTASAQISSLEGVLELYRMDNGAYPTTEQGLAALVTPATDEPRKSRYPPGGYLRGGVVPLDPWGNLYQYRAPGHHNPSSFDLWSLGADGLPGGTCIDAGIGNWVRATPSLLDCPREHPLAQSALLSAVVTGIAAILSLAVLLVVRSAQVLRGHRRWRSVLSRPPLLMIGALLVLFTILTLAVTVVP